MFLLLQTVSCMVLAKRASLAMNESCPATLPLTDRLSPGQYDGCEFTREAELSGSVFLASGVDHIILNKCKFTKCVVTSINATNHGGAIYLQGASACTATECEFSECSAHFGGAIFQGWPVDRSVVEVSKTKLINCVFTKCTSEAGGVIAVFYGSASIEKGTFTECSAKSGAVVYQQSEGTLTVSEANFEGCTAESMGGVFSVDIGSIVIEPTCTFTKCSAKVGGVLHHGSSSASVSSISGSKFIDCSASADGGVMYFSTVRGNETTAVISKCEVQNCVAAGKGGFIFFDRNPASLELNEVTINGAQALEGGVIYTDGVNTIKMNGCSFSKCVTKDVNGSATNGAVVYLAGSAVICATDCTFTECSGRIGGAVFQGWPSDNSIVEQSKTQFINCAFTKCTSEVGGVLALFYGSASIEKGTFTECSAKSGAVVYQQCNGTLTVSEAKFEGCTAESMGGVFSVDIGSIVIEPTCTFTKCSAKVGGVLYHGSSSASVTSISGSKFIDCSASSDGAVMYFSTVNADNAKTVISDCEVQNCVSGGKGGFIFFKRAGATLSVSSISVTDCTAAAAGAIYVDEAADFQWTSLCIQSCGENPVVSKVNQPSEDDLVAGCGDDSTHTPPGNDSALSGGAVAAIAGGSVVGVIVIVCIILHVIKKRKAAKYADSSITQRINI